MSLDAITKYPTVLFADPVRTMPASSASAVQESVAASDPAPSKSSGRIGTAHRNWIKDHDGRDVPQLTGVRLGHRRTRSTCALMTQPNASQLRNVTAIMILDPIAVRSSDPTA